MEKVFIEKEEPIAEIIERLQGISDDEVVLVIPRESRIKESQSNFRLLSREAAAFGKKIMIESVDDDVRSYASRSGIESSHPLFEKTERIRSISDIVAHKKHTKKTNLEKPEKKSSAEYRSKKISKDNDDEGEGQFFGGGVSGKEWHVANGLHDNIAKDEESIVEAGLSARSTRRPWFFPLKRRQWLVVLSLLGVVAVFWAGTRMFAEARIALQLKKIPWEYKGVFSAATAEKTANLSRGILPAQLLRMEKSVTQVFPATGKSSVSRKASGILVIYNAFSSSPQTLVATTRFLIPDGVLFRLDQNTVVPGAEIKDGKIIPSSIKARVTADKPGDSYNTGPVNRLTIPGFKGTPRYEGFYGVLEEGARGGFVGVRAVPTEADKAQAKTRIEEMLRSAFDGLFLKSVPEEFIVLPETASFTVEKLVINEDTDEKGNFSVLGSAVFRAFAFSRKDIESMVDVQAETVYQNSLIRGLSIEYSNAVSDFERALLSATVTARGTLMPDLDIQKLKEEIAGKRQKEAGNLLRAIPDLIGAKISFWPLWVRRVPENINRVNVIVE